MIIVGCGDVNYSKGFGHMRSPRWTTPARCISCHTTTIALKLMAYMSWFVAYTVWALKYTTRNIPNNKGPHGVHVSFIVLLLVFIFFGGRKGRVKYFTRKHVLFSPPLKESSIRPPFQQSAVSTAEPYSSTPCHDDHIHTTKGEQDFTKIDRHKDPLLCAFC
jgi:hypothetical protein